jgi:hypothetical protein
MPARLSSSEVEAATPMNANGAWDFLWKEGTEPLRRCTMLIQQHGNMVSISLHGGHQSGIFKRGGMAGRFRGNQLEFMTESGKAHTLRFRGTITNSMIVGTSDTAIDWLAMRHFD